jgi:hypothetical protein
MSIMDFPELLPEEPEQKFCFDEDINQIVKMLDDICISVKAIAKISREWEVWSHVPQYGFRLSYELTMKEKLPDDFFDGVEKVVRFAKAKHIELSPCGLIYYDFEWEKPLTGYLSIYSTFLDERKKIKKKPLTLPHHS